MSCCIVVPVYKSLPDYKEVAALKQGVKMLPNHKFIIACSKNLDVTSYAQIMEESSFTNFSVERFRDYYFASISGYNKLLLSPFFYKRFNNYKYMLIYQLDAWIFKNELDYWCNKDYDYIGAPWFEGFNEATRNAKFYAVGNGGFSLRKISSYTKVLTSFATIRPFKQLWKTFRDDITIRSTVAFLLRITVINKTFFLLNDYSSQEDHFWSLVVPKKFNWFKIPEPSIAALFATEVNADQLYETNNRQLPFGCHAWEKYHPEFWKHFIKV